MSIALKHPLISISLLLCVCAKHLSWGWKHGSLAEQVFAHFSASLLLLSGTVVLFFENPIGKLHASVWAIQEERITFQQTDRKNIIGSAQRDLRKLSTNVFPVFHVKPCVVHSDRKVDIAEETTMIVSNKSWPDSAFRQKPSIFVLILVLETFAENNGKREIVDLEQFASLFSFLQNRVALLVCFYGHQQKARAERPTTRDETEARKDGRSCSVRTYILKSYTFGTHNCERSSTAPPVWVEQAERIPPGNHHGVFRLVKDTQNWAHTHMTEKLECLVALCRALLHPQQQVPAGWLVSPV